MNIEKIYNLLFDETPVKPRAVTESKQPSAYHGETSANFDREIKNIRRNFSGETSVAQSSRKDATVKSETRHKAFESSYDTKYSPEDTQIIDITENTKPMGNMSKTPRMPEKYSEDTQIIDITESTPKYGKTSKYPYINIPEMSSTDTQTIDVTESTRKYDKTSKNFDKIRDKRNNVAQEAPLMTFDIQGNLVPVKEAVTEDEAEEREFDTVTFDEEAFAESIEIEPESITGIFIPATEEEEEHLEISYERQDEIVAIKVFEDGSIEQTVNADILDEPEFEAFFEDTLDENGEIIEGDATLVLTPILEEEEEEEEEEEDEEDLDLPKTEEDVIADSEEDNDTEDEDGNIDSEEYVDPSGLDLDEYYSTTHKMKAVQNPGNRLIGNTRSHTISQESRRPKTIRKPSEEMKISLSTKKGKGSSTEKVRPTTVRK
jgi:hypothetical protein